MNAAQVVPHEVNRYDVSVIFDFARECVCEPSEATHGHPHCEILPLDETGRNVARIGSTGDYRGLCCETHGRAVPLLRLRRLTVDLYEHRKINISAERLLDGP